ncbi:hypothetical protein ALC152_03800 [Arcobacter sp. 15-2]|uniref:hypothetical protein n=1 Tax=Arcobacter sp. 15-2 TaxID=3374109 RepID=UPI00399C4E28
MLGTVIKITIIISIFFIGILTVSESKISKDFSITVIKRYNIEDINIIKKIIEYNVKGINCKYYSLKIENDHNYKINSEFYYDIKDYDCSKKIEEIIRTTILTYK